MRGATMLVYGIITDQFEDSEPGTRRFARRTANRVPQPWAEPHGGKSVACSSTDHGGARRLGPGDRKWDP